MNRTFVIAGSCLAAAVLIGLGQSYLETTPPPAPSPRVAPVVKPLARQSAAPPAVAKAQPPAAEPEDDTLSVEQTLALLKSTSDWSTVDNCVVSLENSRDATLLGPSLERLDQLGLLDKPRQLPWFSKKLLAEFLRSAQGDDLRRGLKLLAAKPALASTGLKTALAQRLGKETEPGAKAALAVELAQLRDGGAKNGTETPAASTALHN